MARKSIAQISVFFIILISVATWYIVDTKGSSESNPLSILPSDAALLIEIDNPGNVIERVNNDNAIYNELIQIPVIGEFNRKLIELDSLLAGDVEYSTLINESPAYVAVFVDSIAGPQVAILSNISKDLNLSYLTNYLESKLNRDYGILELAGVDDGLKIVDAGTGITQYIAIIKNVLVYTSSSDLLYRISETSEKYHSSLSENTDLIKVKQSSGSKVQARIYIQYKELSRLMESTIDDDRKVIIDWLGEFAQWTEFDVLLKKSELILSGFTLSDSIANHASSFINQKPVELRGINILPYNTNTILWIGVSDFSAYFYSIHTKAYASDITKRFNYDIDSFLDLIGDEIVFASNAETIGSYNGNSWFAVRVKNVDKANQAINRISRNLGNSKKTKHNNYTIGQVRDNDFISLFFGDAFAAIENNYFTMVGDYLVFANSENSLINLISNFETGKTLDLNDNFKVFSDNIASKSNVLIYIKPSDVIGRINQYFNNTTSRKMEMVEKEISSFQGLSFQMSGGNKLAYTNVYTKYARGYHEENLALWKVKLKDKIVSGPFLVSDHNTKSKNILIFDKLNNMYLVNADGNIMWNRKVDDKPISDVFEVDYFKNNKIQYLFNTSNYIYLVDKKGNDVSGYPKKLHKKATNGIVVFDYLNNKDYRLLVAQSDKKVYNYSKAGKEISGWVQPKMQNIVVSPVERLLANKKDYIIITDIENEIKIVDRKGKRRIRVSTSLKKAKNSSYYVNRTNSKGIIITTNETGKLVYISASGKLNYTDFGEFSPNHFFLYEDFNGDKSIDFIFIDNNKLQVFDRFKKVLFSYDFGSSIGIKPSFFKLGRKQHVLGVVADQEKTIYLFDKKGNIIISKGLVSETQFNVGDIQNNGKINLVSAADNMLYNYRLR